MKVILCLALCIWVCVRAEFCAHDDDCDQTMCVTGLRVDCYHHKNEDHVCTCVPNGHGTDFKCATQSDCANLFGKCNEGDHQWHCNDSTCRCIDN